MKRLFSFLGNRAPPKPIFTAPLAPAEPFIVIGDVHGCFDAYCTLLERIVSMHPGEKIICVGDLVDRGENSADVLRLTLERDAQPDFICLKGNHEHMLLRFLQAPEEQGARWLRYGGLQTLASFGIGLRQGQPMETVRDALAEKMGEELIRWLTNLPLQWVSGNVAVVHAAAHPAHPINKQSERVLMWGHPEFFQTPRNDGLWVVHGHTIVDVPHAKDGRIAVDTGAFGTGVLTAARVSVDGVSFINTE